MCSGSVPLAPRWAMTMGDEGSAGQSDTVVEHAVSPNAIRPITNPRISPPLEIRLVFVVKAFTMGNFVQKPVHIVGVVIAFVGEKAELRRKLHIDHAAKLAPQE